MTVLINYSINCIVNCFLSVLVHATVLAGMFMLLGKRGWLMYIKNG